ncbi:MAG TPA: alpha/beta fold hydrolase [Pseudolysinimonas sp.]|jgi:S-formylglutathione hydrolase FrmB|nr:alpha/beta fold hydrolase [Pseudolysinimonas sp.]
MSGRLSRRGLLLGGLGVLVAGATGVAGIEAGLIPGRTTLHALLGLNGPDGEIPEAVAGPAVRGEFVSEARGGARCGWTISYPPGAAVGDALPVVVILHGYDGTNRTAFTKLGFDSFQANARSPFALGSVDGGNSYWHPRRSGGDSGAMVVDEFLPLLGDHGLRTDRIGLIGWSMGGYGALLLASQLGPDRVAGVVAQSPAMWVDAGHSPEGAFDDAEDYAAHDLAGRQGELDGIPVRIDCGTGDGFYPVVRDYAAGFSTPPAGGFEPGGHDVGYWRRVIPPELEFLAQHVA